MRCRWCHRSVKDSEAVHRVSMPYTFPWPDGSYPLVGYICTACAGSPVFGTDWLEAVSCSHCRRPVIHDKRRKLPKYVVCSEECQRAIYRRLNSSGREIPERLCKFCAKMFAPKKTTTLYCSNICKTRAYQKRAIPKAVQS